MSYKAFILPEGKELNLGGGSIPEINLTGISSSGISSDTNLGMSASANNGFKPSFTNTGVTYSYDTHSSVNYVDLIQITFEYSQINVDGSQALFIINRKSSSGTSLGTEKYLAQKIIIGSKTYWKIDEEINGNNEIFNGGVSSTTSTNPILVTALIPIDSNATSAFIYKYQKNTTEVIDMANNGIKIVLIKNDDGTYTYSGLNENKVYLEFSFTGPRRMPFYLRDSSGNEGYIGTFWVWASYNYITISFVFYGAYGIGYCLPSGQVIMTDLNAMMTNIDISTSNEVINSDGTSTFDISTPAHIGDNIVIDDLIKIKLTGVDQYGYLIGDTGGIFNENHIASTTNIHFCAQVDNTNKKAYVSGYSYTITILN